MEFYQNFGSDIKVFFLLMVKERIQTGTLPMALSEGVLTFVQKPGTQRYDIKSYRPTTL